MQRHPFFSLLLVSVCALFASCGGPRLKTFEFRAIDDKREEVPCMIVVDDRWPETPDAGRYTFGEDDGMVEIDYTGREVATVQLVPVDLDGEGNMIELPRAGQATNWRCPTNPRDVEYSDLSPVLYIFVPDRGGL
jgi:hypothetical protein